ncbi:hypothetical protein ACN47E_002489 [Coniothyrium glycines]
MAQFKLYPFKHVAETALQAKVFFRSGASTVKKPIAIYYHGGSFVVGSKDMLAPHYVEKLLDLGFGAVVSPDYRLTPTISVYEGPVTDSLDAYNWASNELPKLLSSDSSIEVDGDRIVSFGHSCGGTLALLTANAAKPPRAILDLFGMKYLKDESYHTPAPLPVPTPDKALIDQVFQQVPPPIAAPPPFGPNGMDASTPRNAFFVSGMKAGTLLSSAVQDGNYDRVDPATLFSSSFPPTYFANGTADTLVSVKLTEKAHEELKAQGVESVLEILEGANHGFDVGKGPGTQEVDTVFKGLEFLRAHV